MKTFMLCAVEATIIPRMIKHPPSIATYRRPMRSEREPTNGQTAAKARRLARTCHMISIQAASSPDGCQTYKPCPSIGATNVAGEQRVSSLLYIQWDSSTGISRVVCLLSALSVLILSYHMMKGCLYRRYRRGSGSQSRGMP